MIPKAANPGSLAECRNISCTSVFSKVLENQLLAKLRAELDPDSEQYGGVKECGAENMLVNLWEEVLSSMEGGRCAGVLLGVDFEKAFNRMDHNVCLRQLKRLGALDGSISLVRAFLKHREMTITIDGHTPTPITIWRGNPQGSVLGCLLYCVTTQHIMHDLDPVPRSSNDVQETGVPLPRIGAGQDVNYFPQDDSRDDGIEFWDHEGDGGVPRTSGKVEVHRARDTVDGIPRLISFKYIDDTTIFAPANLDEAAMHLTTGRTVQRFEGLCLGPVLECLSKRSDDIGMKINTKKTQLLGISPPNGCNTTAVMKVGESLIESCPMMKLLGFHFGESPGIEVHVVQLRHKFRRKIWIIYHLREAGLNCRPKEDEL